MFPLKVPVRHKLIGIRCMIGIMREFIAIKQAGI